MPINRGLIYIVLQGDTIWLCLKKKKKSLKGVLKTNISDYVLIGGRQRVDFKCHGVFNPSLSLDI